MWIFSKFIILCSFIIFLPALSSAQNCNVAISGYIEDVSTRKPISYANIFITELQSGEVTDSLGSFRIESICAGEYHFVVSHIGFETQKLYLNITVDTTITVVLNPSSQQLSEVAIIGQGGKVTTQETQSLNSESIAQNSDKNLATMLENISGVSTIKNGSGIANQWFTGFTETDLQF